MRQGSWVNLALGLMCFGGLVLMPAGSAQAGVVGTVNSTTTNTTSTTHHETDIRVDNYVNNYSTTVLGIGESHGQDTGSVTAYSQTYNSYKTQAEVTTQLQDAANFVNASMGDPEKAPVNPNIGSGAVYNGEVLPGRVCQYTTEPNWQAPAVSQTQNSNTVMTSNNTIGTNTTTTNTVTIGPGTVLIGDDQSGSFFVAAGNTNINTNTHFETFYQPTYLTTTNNATTYTVTGDKFVSPIILDLSNLGGVQASDGVYLPHKQQFHLTHRAIFDFYGNGFPVAMEWVGPKDGLLCRPKADGTVDGTCLFGTSTGYQTGFEQLASLDLNNDYRVTGQELEGLMVWQDKNGNAKVDPGELTSLQSLGITELNVKANNMKSTFTMNGKKQAMFDWWPSVLQLKRNSRPSV